ncbi:MAG TPA: hypothetical protein VM529_19465, partial [Gemmata sp.]|nr:hypothetical protein [Gemmata sp.]
MPTPPFRRPSRGQPPASSQTARMMGDLERMSQTAGSGDVGFGQGGGGIQFLDSRPVGFWAVIQNQVGSTNAYGFLRVDDGDGGTYPTLDPTHTTAQGDGEDVPAYEVAGRTDVPADGTVTAWLEPNRMGPGYTFKYGEATDSGAACESAGCDGLVGLEEDWCVKLTLACHEGRFADMGEEQFAAVFGWYDEVEEGWIFYRWDPEVPDWVEFEMNWGGGTGNVVLTFEADGTPVLTVGGTLTMYYEPCATGGRFTGGPRNGFTGGTAPDPCEPNAFTVVVECSCCPPDRWQGPGVYCLVDEGETCGDLENACVELLEEDICDETLVICSGPYATLEECEGVCVTLGAAPSCTDAPASGVAATLYYRIDAPSGVAACADGQTGTMLEGTDTWSASAIGPGGCGATNDMTLRCDVTYPDEWELSVATTFGGCGVYGGNVAASAG